MRIRTRTTLVLSILLVALIALVGCSQLQQPEPAVQTTDGYANPDVLVDTEWVAQHLDDENVKFLDVSSNQEAYAEGHLPGAQFVDWQSDLTNPEDPVRGQVLSRNALSDLLSRLGVEKDDTVVLYDDTNNLFATRAYWALKYYQHDDVRVYNGGTKQWTAANKELTTEEPTLAASAYEAGEADPAIRTTWQYVVDHAGEDGVVFCDTRSPEEHTGTDVRADRGGHIPGSINVEWTAAVNDDGTFKSAQELSELYQNAGFTPDSEIITYCQTGVRGAHTWFVLTELLGYPEVRNYDGSWEEYGNIADSPIDQ